MNINAAYDLQNIQAYLKPDSRGLLVGVYSCKIDRRGRVTIPKTLREVLLSGGGTEIGIYTSGECLAVMPVTREKDATGPLIAVADSGISAITIRQLTPRGLLSIPEALRLDAELSGTVLCRGMGWKLELWNPRRYQAHMRRVHLERPPAVVPCAREITLRHS